MRQGHNPRRGRSRSGPGHRSGGGQQKYKDPNRSDPKVKGNPRQQVDKYKSLARDAMLSGDRVQAEKYFQYADHYQRVLNERTPRPENQPDHSNRDKMNGQQPGHANQDNRQPAEARQQNAPENIDTVETKTAPAPTPTPTPTEEKAADAVETKPKKRTRAKPKTDKVIDNPT